MIESSARRLFLTQYGQVRAAEGRGSNDAAYYRALPFVQAGQPLADQWAIRSRTYRYFVSRILPKAPSRILDLGAGNGWLSHRLSQLGHASVALDIFRDERDGLLATENYDRALDRVEAEFDTLPFRMGAFDLAVFNASFHYSHDYAQTLTAVRRVIAPNGRIVILDTPVYRMPEHGLRMREERQRQFQHQYGFRSEALRSIEFLDKPAIARLGGELGIHWRIHRPWYGIAWHLRPLRAILRGQRPPSRFWILEGSWA